MIFRRPEGRPSGAHVGATATEAEGEANVTAHLRAQELTAPSSEAEAMARRRALRFALDRTEAALRGRTPPATPPPALEG